MAITKQYQVTDEVEIDFVYKSPSPVVLCPRYENGERAIKVKLKNAGEDYPVPEGYTPYVYGVKFDKKLVDNLCEYDGNIVMVEVTKQLSAVEGRNVLRIALVNDETGEYAQTSVIYLRVTEGADFPGAERSTDEFGALVQYMKQANASAESAKASETSAKSDRIAAQAARAGAEAAESRVNAIVAGNESYTKRQSRDMFALALKATAEKAANLEIHPDEGSNVAVTSYGFTEQAGTGDPSPTNVRQITVGGKKLVEVVFNGSESWGVGAAGRINTVLSIPAVPYGTLYANCIKKNSITTAGGAFTDIGKLWLNPTGGQFSSVYPGLTVDNVGTEWPKRLKEKPLIIWYQPADESQATGIYTPIESTGAEYSCVCVPLTANLCDGDTVETCVKSGCDKKIVLDGTETLSDISNRGTVTRAKINGKPLAPSGFTTVFCNKLNRLDSWTSNTAHCYVEVYPYIFIENSKLTSTDALGVQKHLASAYEEGEPYILWYRSTEYTPENDMPVCLEKHKNTYKEYLVADMNNTSENYPGWQDTSVFGILGSGVNNAVPGSMSNIAPKGIIRASTLGSGVVFFTKDQFGGLTQTDFKATYPNLVVQVTLPYKTPITYAHDPVYLEAYPDGNGKFTVSGEKLVSARYNKSLSKAFEELQAAVLAMGAKLSS